MRLLFPPSDPESPSSEKGDDVEGLAALNYFPPPLDLRFSTSLVAPLLGNLGMSGTEVAALKSPPTHRLTCAHP